MKGLALCGQLCYIVSSRWTLWLLSTARRIRKRPRTVPLLGYSLGKSKIETNSHFHPSQERYNVHS